MTTDNIYKAFKDAVEYYPNQEYKCLKPRTFAVLEDISMLSTTNLGKVICDKDRPYFHSELWQEKQFNPSDVSFDFPLVVLFNDSINTKDIFKKGYHTTKYNLQLLVLDKMDKSCAEKNICNDRCFSRTAHDIFRDTEQIGNTILTYLKGCILIGGEFVHETKPNIVKPDHLIYLIDGETKKFNETIQGQHYSELSPSLLYGTFWNVAIQSSNCYDDVQFNFTVKSKTEIADGSC